MTVNDAEVAAVAEDAQPDPSTAPVPTSRSTLLRTIGAAFALPAALFLALQPERVGLVPNNLDPWFYTGYAANFDDIFREIWDGHYFVSRWTAYMPGRALGWVFGAEIGRLVLRWLVAGSMVLAIWSLGRRWAWSGATRFVTGIVVLTTPVFVRAFMTDYVEWVFVSAGFVLVCQALEPSVTKRRSVLIGALAAVVVIANPLAVTIALGPGVAYLARRTLTWRERATHAAIGVAAAAATVLGGWAYFRVVHGMPDVYEPTIAFIRERSATSDPLRSPRLTWMGAFVWIYIPPLIVAGVFAVRSLREHVLRHRAAAAAVVLMALQYGFQWIDQFVRGGNGLEISYYWSFMSPTIGVALAVTLGAVRWSNRAAAAFAAVWVAVIAITSQERIAMPGGVWFVLVALVVVGVVAVAASRSATAGVGALAVFLLLTQVAAPRYDPSAYHPYNMDPKYSQIFFHPSSSAAQFDEALWLEDVLDTLPSDDDLYFAGFGEAITIVGIYGPHVTGHWVIPTAEQAIPPESIAAIAAGAIGQLVLFGPPSLVDAGVEQVRRQLGSAATTLEVEHDGGLRYGITVLEFPDPATQRTTWPAAALFAQTGTDVGTLRTAVPVENAPGFIVYGPYARLSSGPYRVSVTYSSPADPSSTVAVFDLATGNVSTTARELPGTAGAPRTVTLDIPEAAGTEWEFRVNWDGEHPVTVESITSEPVAAG